MRTVLALTLSVILASAVQAEAGEVIVENCANRDGVLVEFESFNSTDTVFIAPYEKKKIRRYETATLRCASEYCVVGVRYEANVDRNAIGGLSALTLKWSANTYRPPRVGSFVYKGRVCAYPKYGEDGRFDVRNSSVVHGSMGCDCD